jgi:hypothetical protein
MGSECVRKIQFDWFCSSQFPARTLDILYHFHNGLNRDLEGEEMA